MKLKDFKLSGMYANLEERLSYAQEKSLSYLEFLTLLLEDELNNRRANSYRKRYSKAKLPAQKQIEDFDFSFQPSIDKRTINDCITCQFIRERRNIVFIGNPGTGNYRKNLVMERNDRLSLFCKECTFISFHNTSQ
jgi:DNA replication protein DnaC